MTNSTKKTSHTREIVVLSRGFIFVGQVTDTPDGVWIRNAHNIRTWKRNGFGGMTSDPVAAGVILDATRDFFVPHHPREALVLHRIPVDDAWGATLV